MNERTAARYAAREADWRNGPVVYQVLVDRFAPPADLEGKRELYAAPRTLHGWDEHTPHRGEYLPDYGLWTHELAFWGGDLASVRGRLDHLRRLGVDVLYLNPIQAGLSNHKYDGDDPFAVAPEFGTRADVAALARDLHAAGMRLVLDGVFNHLGRRSPWFQEALADPESPWRRWFVFGEEYAEGYRGWYDVPNLPELNLEEPAVRARLWGDPDSVVQGYLREEDVDGWRLDVAFDIGPEYLAELTAAAHAAKPDALVVGEVYNYPDAWLGVLDGLLNMTVRELILALARGELAPARCGRLLAALVADAGLERLLKSWLVLDNHDTVRLATALPEPWQRDLAQVLQLTLPGAPQLYYGVEVGLTGGDDPEMRAPMPWDAVEAGGPELERLAGLLRLRRGQRALRVGDLRVLETDALLAYVRHTERARETVLVALNPGAAEVTETLLVPDAWLMNGVPLRDLRDGHEVRLHAGVVRLSVPARGARILAPVVEDGPRYSPYKRVP